MLAPLGRPENRINLAVKPFCCSLLLHLGPERRTRATGGEMSTNRVSTFGDRLMSSPAYQYYHKRTGSGFMTFLERHYHRKWGKVGYLEPCHPGRLQLFADVAMVTLEVKKNAVRFICLHSVTKNQSNYFHASAVHRSVS